MLSRKPDFRIKICGIVNPQDYRMAVELGADAIGFNFYPQSPRYIAPEVVGSWSHPARGKALRVGVFVDADPSWVAHVARTANLDRIQLHGSERPGDWADWSGPPCWKAIGWRGDLDAECAGSWVASGVSGLLIDAYAPEEKGGTGKVARWDLLVPRPPCFGLTPMILAGGLRPGNVAQAIETVRPDAVDTASGVEIAPGRKDPEKLAAFIQEAIKGYARLLFPAHEG
jgi:phosphoribosylanthranilate isomerase